MEEECQSSIDQGHIENNVLIAFEQMAAVVREQTVARNN